jgi:hypothetical protein
VSCPSGLYVVGGGGHIDGDQSGEAGVIDAQPTGSSGFAVNFGNGSGQDQTATVYASCIPANSVG